MMPAFAHSELLSALWIQRGLTPQVLAPGTVNTYDASPQPAAGIDSWDSGAALYSNLVIVIDVSVATGTGGLVVTLRDSDAAITTANGDASTKLAATLATITTIGLYTAELQLTHCYPKTSARYLADADFESVCRHHSLRAVATTHTYTFAAWIIYGRNSRKFPVQDATSLAVTWYDA
jgi:hypothetical protein